MKNLKFNYKINTTVLLLGILLTACPKLEEIRIDQETKDYCLFAEGSYWIYQDSVTLIIDSVVINNPIDYRFSRSNANGCACETYSTNISLYSQNNMFVNFVNLTTVEADADILKPCILVGHSWGIMYHNCEVMEKVPNRSNAILLIASGDNYSINGVTFDNIKKFEYNYLEEKEIYYWAKYTGLVRKEIYKKDSLISIKNLIKYSVKPYNK